MCYFWKGTIKMDYFYLFREKWIIIKKLTDKPFIYILKSYQDLFHGFFQEGLP